MNNFKIYCILLILSFAHTVKAQEISNTNSNVKNSAQNSSIVVIDEPLNLTLNHYSNSTPFERSFDYSLVNKERRLRMAARLICVGGSLLGLGIIGTGSYLAAIEICPVWLMIPLEAAAVTGVIVGTIYAASAVINKADAIKVAPIYSYNIGNNVSVSAVGIGISADRKKAKKMGVGIGLAANF